LDLLVSQSRDAGCVRAGEEEGRRRVSGRRVVRR